ncbi:glucuronate isomerase [Enterococcus sp. BWB1-3]|uniref:glucuronate isomerase n=1 Tax=unclassified Enterococcus TaxID=2608891 RepID=UPI00192055ED|nr:MULTISPECIES: glucuronate isomerase [unclassified Enterococcus]MBL1230507.1 glucuronate isomerase [Enterococcus sp. BWB1-3]MCB5954222.1 glucuronate isomerase [Enterococcus sp. CWB-B31]
MFIHHDFLLQTELAKKLYHESAEHLPIIDYHCHLEPQMIAENTRFLSITELWLGGDHYKWRAMRACGIDERYITGDSSDWEKFQAWAQTVERLLGNALYHWTHLELKQYFGITELLNTRTAEQIYNSCNEYLAAHEVTAQSLIIESNVQYIGTTDDILSDLSFHQVIAASDLPCTVAPSFRPDPILGIEKAGFSKYIHRIDKQTKTQLTTFEAVVKFLEKRIDYFHKHGGTISDHGFTAFVYAEASEEELDAILQKALADLPLSTLEIAQWQGQLLHALGKIYHRYGWVMQLHFGAVRSANTRLFNRAGPDSGGDSIYDQAELACPLNQLLDSLDKTNQLPKTILYNLNPNQNDLIAATAANFQMNDHGIKSRVQFGAGWWFNDTYRGMINQMEALADGGILMNFLGMLTDSRSFLSYSRHHYFRRILANYLAEKVEAGIYPNDYHLLTQMIQEISFLNAETYFNLRKRIED